MEKECKLGCLYVVATPIGNLEDITLRAIRVLGEVDLVAAEDTRHTRKLLSHLALSKPLISYYKDREASRSRRIVDELLLGSDVALVSDAGTPGISDPGAILVNLCRDNNIPVIPVPGPSALTALFSVSGFSQSSFVFLGFLPTKKSECKKILLAHSHDDSVLVFYESPRRICKSLVLCSEIFGERKVFIGRELTKIYEEFLSGNITEVLCDLEGRNMIKGEFVVAVAPGIASAVPEIEDLSDLLSWYRDESGFSMKDSVKKIAVDLNLARSYVYKKALPVWKLR